MFKLSNFFENSVTKVVGQRHQNSGPFPTSVIFLVSFLHLQNLSKLKYNGFYSFSISHFVLELFRFVWYVDEINHDVKSYTDYCIKSCTCISSGLLNESWFCLILVCRDAFSCKYTWFTWFTRYTWFSNNLYVTLRHSLSNVNISRTK